MCSGGVRIVNIKDKIVLMNLVLGGFGCLVGCISLCGFGGWVVCINIKFVRMLFFVFILICWL